MNSFSGYNLLLQANIKYHDVLYTWLMCVVLGEFEVTLRAIYKSDKQKRRDIAEKYFSTFHRDLIGDMKELSWKAGFITEALLVDRLSGAARYLLYRLQSGTWKQNMAAIEIVCGHTASELTEIQKEYWNICGRTLISDVQAKYDDEEVGHILIERLSLKVFGLYHLPD